MTASDIFCFMNVQNFSIFHNYSGVYITHEHIWTFFTSSPFSDPLEYFVDHEAFIDKMLKTMALEERVIAQENFH